MMIAATRTTIAALIQRPGCRTGTALMSSGRPVGAWTCCMSADPLTAWPLGRRPVDRRVLDRALLDPPLVEDLRIGAVGHELLQRVVDRLGHAGALRDRNAVRRGPIVRPDELELPVGLLD